MKMLIFSKNEKGLFYQPYQCWLKAGNFFECTFSIFAKFNNFWSQDWKKTFPLKENSLFSSVLLLLLESYLHLCCSVEGGKAFFFLRWPISLQCVNMKSWSNPSLHSAQEWWRWHQFYESVPDYTGWTNLNLIQKVKRWANISQKSIISKEFHEIGYYYSFFLFLYIYIYIYIFW